ncbi:putative nucleotidyltransferase [Xenococcus sp. PCC 7305]|uniref:nucleotidyltransferase family protein n=1 Tax=Xenococcus sp. PCC 7305 TaxID=102125 RepID=UPI0002ABED66|nr:nucleotidyltransferase domain-containing protein [Xenococcus sp. PCC 7305]ELS03368.1 putative nucleotidyltransferase [Xenococcus sp. PCC 7305]
MTNQEIPHQATHSQKVMSQEQLRKLLTEFKEKCGAKFHLTALGYFGSYARGEARPDSDVDIVFATTDPDLFMTSIMKQDLETWLNRSVDVIRLHPYLNPKFKARLEHEIIYV